jgi:hypothetical protein
MQAWRQNTLDVTKQSIAAQLSALTAGVASIITTTSVGQDNAFDVCIFCQQGDSYLS